MSAGYLRYVRQIHHRYQPKIFSGLRDIRALLTDGLLINQSSHRLRDAEIEALLAGLGFVIAGCLLIPLATISTAQPVVFSAVAILAMGTGLVTPCLRALVSRRLDASGQGAALGSLQGLQSLGSFVGPPLAGLAYDLIGQRSPFWLGILLLTGVALLVAGGLPGRTVKPEEHTN